MKFAKNFLKYAPLLFLFFTVLGTVSLQVFGETQVTENMIEVDATWSLAESPYVLTSNVLIMEGAILTIEPGVEIRFAGYYGLAVMGTLNATGSADNPILFTSDSASPSSGDWHSIRSNGDGARIILVHTIIEYSYIGVYDEDSHKTDILIDQSIIRHFSQYGVRFSNNDQDCIITNSEINGSGSNYGNYGIYGQAYHWDWDTGLNIAVRIENNALWIIHKVYFAFTLIVHTCPQTGEKQTNASSEEENSY